MKSENNTIVNAKRVGTKVRLCIEWPVEGEDPDLMRKKSWDLPIVTTLMLAGGLIVEAIGILKLPPSVSRAMDSREVKETVPENIPGEARADTGSGVELDALLSANAAPGELEAKKSDPPPV